MCIIDYTLFFVLGWDLFAINLDNAQFNLTIIHHFPFLGVFLFFSLFSVSHLSLTEIYLLPNFVTTVKRRLTIIDPRYRHPHYYQFVSTCMCYVLLLWNWVLTSFTNYRNICPTETLRQTAVAFLNYPLTSSALPQSHAIVIMSLKYFQCVSRISDSGESLSRNY